MTGVRIDAGRLWDSLQTHAAIGATADGGVCREALTDEDKRGRDLFVDWCRDAGLDVAVDRLGTIYATRRGVDEGLAPVAIGSHLDTQPTGGRYDGVLGVLGGLEVLRALDDARRTTARSITLVNWTGEEGSRFEPSMLASGVYAGVFSMKEIEEVRDASGTSLRQALEAIGYRGPEEVGGRRFHAFLELHIEQGPVLEQRGIEIGVVTGSQAMNWSRVHVGGRAAHAGTTPMAARLDALQAATRLVARCYERANATADARATVGAMEVLPGSHSTVPHAVEFSLDLRHPDDGVLGELVQGVEDGIERERERGFEVSREEFGVAAAQRFDARCVRAVRDAARAGGYGHTDIVSGAGHDAVYLNAVCPTAMIFVPCKGGVSHNPAESITPEQARAGVDVLARAVLDLADSED